MLLCQGAQFQFLLAHHMMAAHLSREKTISTPYGRLRQMKWHNWISQGYQYNFFDLKARLESYSDRYLLTLKCLYLRTFDACEFTYGPFLYHDV